MSYDEINKRIVEITAKIGALQADQLTKTDVMYANGEDVQYHTINRDNSSEIYKLKQELRQLNERAAAYASNRSQFVETTNAHLSEIEQAKLNEIEREKQERKTNFERVKQTYKSQSASTRFKNLVTGKKPKWDKIEKYNSEELAFLVDLSKGRTEYQENRNERYNERLGNQNVPFGEISKRESKRNQEDFNHALVSTRESLDNRMEHENNVGGRSR